MDPKSKDVFENALIECGFVFFKANIWSDYSDVTNWLGMDVETGVLFHVHLHYRVLTGLKSAKEQDLPWVELILNSRIKDEKYGIPIAPPALEVQILLAREIAKISFLSFYLSKLSGKHPIKHDIIEEMKFLLSQSRAADVDYWGRQLWGGKAWLLFHNYLMNGSWYTSQGVSYISKILEPILSQWRNTSKIKACFMRFYGVFVSRGLALLHRFIPETSIKMTLKSRGLMVVFVGSDGAGKSTITHNLRQWIRWKIDAHVVYFGSKGFFYRFFQSKFRKTVHHFLHKKSLNKKKKKVVTRFFNGSFLHGAKSAYVANLRYRNMCRANRLMCRGQIVFADRFPQFEVHGTYDGFSGIDYHSAPILSKPFYLYENWVEKRLSLIKPDLIVRMIVTLEKAIERKPDHDLVMLAEKISLTRTLKFNGINSCEIDCTQPLEKVLLDAKVHMWSSISKINKC